MRPLNKDIIKYLVEECGHTYDGAVKYYLTYIRGES